MRKCSKCPALVVCLCEKEEITAKVRCSPGRLTREPVNSNSIVTLQTKELTLEVTGKKGTSVLCWLFNGF